MKSQKGLPVKHILRNVFQAGTAQFGFMGLALEMMAKAMRGSGLFINYFPFMRV